MFIKAADQQFYWSVFISPFHFSTHEKANSILYTVVVKEQKLVIQDDKGIP